MEVITALLAQRGQTQSSWPFLLAVVVGTVVLLYFTRRRTMHKDTPLRSYARAQRAEFGSRQSIEKDLREVMIELESLAREVNAQIDTKYHKLEAVMRGADQRIERLQQLYRADQAGDEGLTQLDVTVGADPAAPATAPKDADRALDRRLVGELTDAGKTPLEIARQLCRPVGEIELVLAVREEHARHGT